MKIVFFLSLWLAITAVGFGQEKPASVVQKTESSPTNLASIGGSKMTNDEVIQLVAAGLSDQVIITSIHRASTKDFDLSPTGLLALKKAGVSDAVIVVMLEREQPATASGPSVPRKYVRKDKSSDYIELNPDGTFSFQEDGKGFSGNYNVKADTITLTSSSWPSNPGRRGYVNGHFTGDTIWFTGGNVYEKQAEPQNADAQLTSGQIIQLVKAGLSEQVLIASIRHASRKDFDLTPTGLISLKKASVPDAVIAVMQERATPEQTPSANDAKTPPRYDPSLAQPQKSTGTPTPPEPSSPCADIDYLGVIQAVTGGGMMAGTNAYGGRVRNRASYTKEVDFAWVMNGRAQTGTFRIPAGQFIDVNLGQGPAPPTNVRVVACR